MSSAAEDPAAARRTGGGAEATQSPRLPPAARTAGGLSPAERYRAARRRQAVPELSTFAAGYPFGLDDFQREACEALAASRGVLVAAPTGAGKTVVGEFAVHLALARGRKCFYTTPIKALSNQKYADLAQRYGAEHVGLLTGDNAINGDAPVVVMTTEVLRNMIYARSEALRGLGYVVMDEVHYLADRFRGAVWEEVIIHLPDDVLVVSLSATVSNAEEFGEWLHEVRGDTDVVVSEERPVPLWQSMLVEHRLYDLYVDDPGGGWGAQREGLNPELRRRAREDERLDRTLRRRGGGRDRRRPHRGGQGPRRAPRPHRPDVVDSLDRAGMLPAIVFVFSRVGCDAAVAQCLRGGLRLTTPEERAEIRALVDEQTAELPDDDLTVLGYWDWIEGLERGVAAHHAGMLPPFKEVVEKLFCRGLVKVVFATETLALGINMPARSVVLERLSKWNGETHADVTPGEYTQLTGRAGRRGIDVEGHAVVVWDQGIDPAHVAGLASTRTYPLKSSFSPSYNMAVNLVGTVGRVRARELLESSFAQFQADRAVVGLAKQVRRNDEALSGYAEAMACEHGDFPAYAELRRALSARESELAREHGAARRAAAAESVESLRPGDVIRVPAGKRRGLAVVVDNGRLRRTEHRGGAATAGGAAPLVVTESRWSGYLSPADFPVAAQPLGRVKVPRGFNHRNPADRRDLVSSLRASGIADPGKPRGGQDRGGGDDAQIASLRRRLREHPCHRCPEREQHARWAERHHRLARDTGKLRRRVEGRTNTIARTFDRVCALLEARGYLDGDEVTGDGRMLAGLYAESDLLVAECLRDGVWDGLGPADLAACASTAVFEARREGGRSPRLPGGRVREALSQTVHTWARLSEQESEHRLEFLREPDLGFAWAAHRWCSGDDLEDVLTGADLAAGDFVRWTKQVIDLLDQIAAVCGAETRRTARKAVDGLRRGVVAYSSVG